MKFGQLATFLIPVTGVLGQSRAKFDTNGFRTPLNISGGCDGAVITYAEDNELATILLPNYFAILPNRPLSQCHVEVKVTFPTGVCTDGSFLGHVSGIVNVPSGVEGKFEGRQYAVSPTPSRLTRITPNANFPGPRNSNYVLEDILTYTVNKPDVNNRNVTFTLQGQLQLQPTTGPSGLLSNQQIIFDIRNQTQRNC
ncbi:hypothetical protein V8F20_010356 [Naviculisporaceae sp. PSN 640]